MISYQTFCNIFYTVSIFSCFIPILLEIKYDYNVTDGSLQKMFDCHDSIHNSKHIRLIMLFTFALALGCAYVPNIIIDHIKLIILKENFDVLLFERYLLTIMYLIPNIFVLILITQQSKRSAIVFICCYRMTFFTIAYVNTRMLFRSIHKNILSNRNVSLFLVLSILLGFIPFTYNINICRVIGVVYMLFVLYITRLYCKNINIKYMFLGNDTNEEIWKECVVFYTILGICTHMLILIISILISSSTGLKNASFVGITSFMINKMITFVLFGCIYSTIPGNNLSVSKNKVTYLRDFIRQLSHEIRTPMSVVQMALGNISDNFNDKFCVECFNQLTTCKNCLYLFNEIKDGIKDSLESTEVAVGILNDCLDIDKISSGLLHCDLIPTSLGKFIQKTSRIFYGKSVTKNVIFDYSICQQQNIIDLIVNIDPSKMAQVLRNLLSNSLKFTKSGENIKINVKTFYKCESKKNNKVTPFDIESPEYHNWVRVDLVDNGIGISETNISKIFNKSIQIDAHRNQAGGGSGFGLLISKKIIQQHNGNIGVQSDGEGKGSTFWFELPIYNGIINNSSHDDNSIQSDILSNRINLIQETNAINSKSENGIELKSQEIRPETLSNLKPCALIVEDTAICSKFLAKAFEKCNVETVIKENGLDAVNEIKENPNKYDIVLMDNKMPVMNGLDATQEIRRLSFDMPIVGATGNIMDNEINEFKEKGANEVLGKPIKNEHIKDILVRYNIINDF
jgi:signal transduction histidine kinase/ActR/RegA family two-component response regulator